MRSLNDLYCPPNIVRGHKIEKNEMGGACSMYMEEERSVYRVLVGQKTWGKRLLRRPRRRWEDNIKMDLH